MRHIVFIAFNVFLCGFCFAPCGCAETSAELETKGAEALKLSQSDPDAVIAAAIYYGQASAAYARAGDDGKATEMNSYLYWCKKKMTLAQMDTFLKKSDAGEAVISLKALEKPVPVSESRAYFDRADAFARKNPSDHLLVSIRYFEVADRFPESVEGRKAMQLSLAAMQKVIGKTKLAEYKPAATDGKVFIQSEPPGAEIIIVQGEEKLVTGKKTPGIVQLPLGSQKLELELKNYKPGNMSVSVDEKSIAKPEALKLVAITAPVEVLFEADWTVYVDGATTTQKTPCIVELPIGTHTVSLVKDGFRDITQQATVKSTEKVTLEPKSKPTAGPSAVLVALAEKQKKELKEIAAQAEKKAQEMKAFAGKWKATQKGDWKATMEIRADGTFVMTDSRDGGTWTISPGGDELVLNWYKWKAKHLKRIDANSYSEGEEKGNQAIKRGP